MTTYRTHQMPDLERHGDKWSLNSLETGYITANDQDTLVRWWKAAIDGEELLQRVASGDYTETSVAFECRECGAVVSGIFQHDEFHARHG